MTSPVKAAAAMAVVLSAAPVQAGTNILARAGAWDAFGGTTRSGIPVCGVSQEVEGRYFSLKLFSDRSTFALQLGTKEWAKVVVDNAATATSLRFDGNAPWTADGIGLHFDDGAGGLQVDFDKGAMNDFVRQFRSANRLVVAFRNPAMTEWRISLAGTNAVTDAFLGCVRRMTS